MISSPESDPRNIALSMRRSVENLVVSSQDAIGQSISQALTFSGVITSHTTQIVSQEIRNISRSPSPCRQSQEPTCIPESSPFDKSDGLSISVPSLGSGDSMSISSQPDSQQPSKSDQAIYTRVLTPQAIRGNDSTRSKKKSWYSALYPTYKTKSEDFKRIFKELPEDERLIVDYSCALQKDILMHGRLYVSQNYLSFYANIFGWETSMVLKFKDITAITKEKTALVIPNAILVCTESEKNFLTSFSSRDKAYLMLFRVWQNALMGQQVSNQEIWQWVHSCYGEELGFNSDDDQYPREILLDQDKLAPCRISVESMNEEFLEMSGLDLGSHTDADKPMWVRNISQISDAVGDIMLNGDGEGDSAPDMMPTTDLSDSSNSDRDNNKCNNSSSTYECENGHDGRNVLHLKLPIAIDQLFTMLFTNSKFCLELLANRNTSDYTETSWKTNPETGLKCRQVNYTMALSQAVGPKCTYVTETQVMNRCSRPGHMYSVDISTVNANIPYADSFYILVHYCLRRESGKVTSLALYASIKYKKNVWSLVKAFIEKNTWSGIEDFCSLLKRLLLNETDGDSGSHTKRKVRRRRLASSLSGECMSVGSNHQSVCVGNTSVCERGSMSYLYAIIMLLIIVNLLLAYKLYNMPVYRQPVLTESLDHIRETLNTQGHAHTERARVWADALKQAVDALAQTERVISKLIEEIKPTLITAQDTKEHQTNTEL